MKQIFCPIPVSIGDVIELDDSTAHHLFDVLRTTSNERIRVVCPSSVYLGRTLEKPKLEIVEQIESSPNARAELTLCAALIKADRFEWMLQKAAELGATRIVPFTCSRSIIQIDPKKEEKKRQRWNAILEQACRQSNRSELVHIEPVCKITDLAQYKSEISICAYEKEDEKHLLAGTLARPWHSATFVIGPEGGFEADEASRLEEEGFALCSLGSNILRAETAACFVLSAAQYQYEIFQSGMEAVIRQEGMNERS